MSFKPESYTHPYRIFLDNLIVNIAKEIPDDDTHCLLIGNLKTTRESLWYLAPELLNNTLIDILGILRTSLPLDPDNTKNPQWLQNIQTIWEDAVIEIDTGFETGAPSKELNAPPAVE